MCVCVLFDSSRENYQRPMPIMHRIKIANRIVGRALNFTSSRISLLPAIYAQWTVECVDESNWNKITTITKCEKKRKYKFTFQSSSLSIITFPYTSCGVECIDFESKNRIVHPIVVLSKVTCWSTKKQHDFDTWQLNHTYEAMRLIVTSGIQEVF